MEKEQTIFWFDQIGIDDLPLVGGKNAGLGEITRSMSTEGVPVPVGFAVGANLYRNFINQNNLAFAIDSELAALSNKEKKLSEVGARIRALIMAADFSTEQVDSINKGYELLCERTECANCDVAVRSSATAEDLPEASFAGQQESYLNIRGSAALLEACQQCFASLYTDRAIAYREAKGFDHQQVAISVGVQQMVRSDQGCAGVMFTLDTESGFPDVILINGSWGLGESVVKGHVSPDRFMVYKPLLYKDCYVPIIERSCGSKEEKLVYDESSELIDTTKVVMTTDTERLTYCLSDDELLKLSRWAVAIERHYGRPMDIEWAKDGNSGQLFIVQARPETVESRKNRSLLQSYHLLEKSTVLISGASVGSAIVCGRLHYLASPKDIEGFPAGGILLTERTDPDWVPVMRKAAGIITDIGGPTSHAAIVSRELKVPAIVGTGNGTEVLKTNDDVTLDCSQGSIANVYRGQLKFEKTDINIDEIPPTKTELMINVAMPDGAMRWWQLPVEGIGLTRIEFIISSQIRVHPMALLYPEKIKDEKTRASIAALTRGFNQQQQYFVETLALGIGKVAASCYPKPAIIRFSDFKSNEYRGLLGGEYFEPEEQNPMLGLRGASRYYHPVYREAFQLECKAVKHVRETMGLDNVIVMIPFCRTPEEADKVLTVMAEAGLTRGENGLKVYIMCEIPSNIILAEYFAEQFDGFSIGSNDLTQLVLGVDRDSSELNYLFDAGNEAVKRMIVQVINVAHEKGCKIGICGQAPSDHPEFAEFLVNAGIDSISLNPDSIFSAARHISKAENQ